MAHGSNGRKAKPIPSTWERHTLTKAGKRYTYLGWAKAYHQAFKETDPSHMHDLIRAYPDFAKQYALKHQMDRNTNPWYFKHLPDHESTGSRSEARERVAKEHAKRRLTPSETASIPKTDNPYQLSRHWESVGNKAKTIDERYRAYFQAQRYRNKPKYDRAHFLTQKINEKVEKRLHTSSRTRREALSREIETLREDLQQVEKRIRALEPPSVYAAKKAHS